MLTPFIGLNKLYLPDWSSELFKTYLVNGEYIRSNLKDEFSDGIAFTEGGNGYRYEWIPKDEIWLDLCEATNELSFTLIHELHERYLMGHNGMDYDSAHDASNIAEMEARHNPEKVPQILADEISNQVVEV